MIRIAKSSPLLESSGSRLLLCFLKPFRPLSSQASSNPIPPQNPVDHHNFPKQETPIPKGGEDDGAAHTTKSDRTAVGGSYEEEQARVLRAALSHVPRLGWSESAMITAARDLGVSPSIVGSFPRREASLVEFFMDDCLQRFVDRIGSGEELSNLILSDRLAKLVHIRLEMQVPYIAKWPQALSIQIQPANLSTSLKQRAVLVDEIVNAAGDKGSDIDWYVKRTMLGGVYSTSEVYMLTDHSPEFGDTWNFMEHRIRDAFDVHKTVKEVAYLAQDVGNSVGSSVQGFVKKLFQS